MAYSAKKDYDDSDLGSIYEYAKLLVGHTLREMTSGPMVVRDSPARQVKGKFGQYLERYYFGIANNSDSEPDFKTVGLELKSSPLKESSAGDMIPKERIVLNIINYMTVVDETWETSHFMSKNELLLLVLYLYETDRCFLDYLIKYVTLWKIEGEDAEIIRQDWEKIVGKIRSGKAHELSEGDTFYLGACRKGWHEEPRMQPNSDMRAPQRAFSFKTKYFDSILRRIEDSESLVKNPESLRKSSFEELVVSRFSPYVDMPVDDIEAMLGVGLNRHAKNYYAVLARRMMGIESSKICEFEKADVTMKIIRLKHNGMPKESMSFPYFRYKDIARQVWLESDFCGQLESKFFFVVFQMNRDESHVCFKKAFFWNMPYDDMQEAKAVWDITRLRILSGNPENLPKISENRVCHVRPHGRDGSDTVETPDGKRLVKKCFWLNAGYLKEQVEKN